MSDDDDAGVVTILSVILAAIISQKLRSTPQEHIFQNDPQLYRLYTSDGENSEQPPLLSCLTAFVKPKHLNESEKSADRLCSEILLLTNRGWILRIKQ